MAPIAFNASNFSTRGTKAVARIRSVKPIFLRHEKLQELEMEHGALKPMLTFEGLWMVADREGRFEWRPNILKLDILPFIPFDIGSTMNLLHQHRFIFRYEVNGKAYGFIPSFVTHQRPNSRETKSTAPAPPQDELQAFMRMHVQDHEILAHARGEGKGTDINNGKGKEIGNGASHARTCEPAPEYLPPEPEPANPKPVIPENSDLLIQQIASAHPRCEKPEETYRAIVAALEGSPARDGFPARIGLIRREGSTEAALKFLLDKTQLYKRCTDSWPPGERNFITSSRRWFESGCYDENEDTWRLHSDDRAGNNGTKADERANHIWETTRSVFDEARRNIGGVATGPPNTVIDSGTTALDRNPQRLQPRSNSGGEGALIAFPAKAAT